MSNPKIGRLGNYGTGKIFPDLETCGYCVAEYPYAKLKTNAEGDSICPECWKDSAHICFIDDSSCRECGG